MATGAYAQTADAIIDKLVDKGILTVREANELREEADKNFNTAYAVKSGMSDWVTSLKINGDMRGRFEGFYADDPAFIDRTRFRYRLRLGVVATLMDNFEVGLRLTSSEANGSFGGDPISGNTTMTDNGSKKFVYIDLAYGRWTAVNNSFWSAVTTVGKMENPFVFSDLVFDGDYTPEGLAQQFVFNLHEKHALKVNLGGFVLDEIGGQSEDSYLMGAQIRFDSIWTPKISTSVGLAGLNITENEALASNTPVAATRVPVTDSTGAVVDFDPATAGVQTNFVSIANSAGATVPDVNTGNDRVGVNLAHNYNPIVADAAITYNLDHFPRYAGVFPIRLAADYMWNPAVEDENIGYSIGIAFGKSGKRGTWDLAYRWKELQGDAWYEELVDSDFGAFYRTAPAGGGSGYRAGTNIRGHVIKASYSPYDSLTFGVTYFMTEVIEESPAASDSDMNRLQVDAVWKF
ncbi:MAG: putative porin [Verrucomicrobiota bacterium]|nr:putative porin [Verrucomicrobiota bacterium]